MNFKNSILAVCLLLVFLNFSCQKKDFERQKAFYSLIFEDEYAQCMDILNDIEYRTKHDNLNSKGKINPMDSLRLAITKDYVSDFYSNLQLSKIQTLAKKMESGINQRPGKSELIIPQMRGLLSEFNSSNDSLVYLQLKIVLVKILKTQLYNISQEISGNYTQRRFSMLNFSNEIISEENYFEGDTVRILLFPPQNDLNGNWCKAIPLQVTIEHKENGEFVNPVGVFNLKSGLIIQFIPLKKGNYEILANVDYVWNDSYVYEDFSGRKIDLKGHLNTISFKRIVPVLQKGTEVKKRKIVAPHLMD